MASTDPCFNRARIDCNYFGTWRPVNQTIETRKRNEYNVHQSRVTDSGNVGIGVEWATRSLDGARVATASPPPPHDSPPSNHWHYQINSDWVSNHDLDNKKNSWVKRTFKCQCNGVEWVSPCSKWIDDREMNQRQVTSLLTDCNSTELLTP